MRTEFIPALLDLFFLNKKKKSDYPRKKPYFAINLCIDYFIGSLIQLIEYFLYFCAKFQLPSGLSISLLNSLYSSTRPPNTRCFSEQKFR